MWVEMGWDSLALGARFFMPWIMRAEIMEIVDVAC